ncbi:MAG: TetR/AcrR family transcriptional regulator [Traorella sp.]
MKKNNRLLILEEATNLFFDLGYKKTSLRQIANEVGIKEPSIFNHYKNKSEIAETLIKKYRIYLQECTKKYFEGTNINSQSIEFWEYFWGLHFTIMSQNLGFTKFYLEFYQDDPSTFIKNYVENRKLTQFIPSNIENHKRVLVLYSVEISIDMVMLSLLISDQITICDAVNEMLNINRKLIDEQNNIEQTQQVEQFIFDNFNDLNIDIHSIL